MANLVVNEANRYTVDPLYQWDINQELFIYGLSIPDPEIHFTNEALARSLVVIPTVDNEGVIKVAIPNSLLQKPYAITVYICGYEGGTFKTYNKITIPVKARKRPADYTLEGNDGEVYSFNDLTKRIADLETAINVGESTTFYSYTYNSSSNTLVESNKSASMRNYLPLVSTSLKAIKSIIDKLKSLIGTNTEVAEQALSIAKGKNQAKVFSTTEDMKTWLSDSSNIHKCNVGDNIYIVDVEVPDWWISEVLDSADPTTGYYYKIAKLETQKVDLSDLEDKTTPVTLWTNPDSTLAFNAQTIELDLSEYKRFKVLFKESTTSDYVLETEANFKNYKYMTLTPASDSNNNMRAFIVTDTGIQIENGLWLGRGETSTVIIPIEILGYKG